MAMYSWTITKDNIGLGTVGITGPSDGPFEANEIRASDERVKFRMLCDDGEVMCEGWFVGDSASEDGFGPLDDYGECALGAAHIQYKEKGKWVEL